MYYENFDFCKKLFASKKKMLVSKNIKFTHEGTSSVNKNFSFEVIEVSLKGNMWAEEQIGPGKDYFMQDNEGFFGRI